MPFGLRNAAQTFQRFIDQVLRSLPFCYAYLDDILVASPTPEHHREHLRQIFSRLQDHGLRINPEKCVLAAACLDFLGFQVNQEGIRPLEDKVKTIREFPLPSTQRKLRQLLGFVNFYHRFLPSCAQTLQPLHDLLKGAPKGNTPLSWTPAATTAFHSVKDAFADSSHGVELLASSRVVSSVSARSSSPSEFPWTSIYHRSTDATQYEVNA